MKMMDMGLNVADRSAILGHSAEVNLRNYTVTSDNWIEEVLKKAQVTEGDRTNFEQKESRKLA